MSFKEHKTKNPVLFIQNEKDREAIVNMGIAFSSLDRIKILNAILDGPKTMTELSESLSIPATTLNRHVNALENAGLAEIHYQPSKKGKIKYCAQSILSYKLIIKSPPPSDVETKAYTVNMPIGLFSSHSIHGPCGMNGIDAPISSVISPSTFLLPERTKAEQLWFDYGKIDYTFPLPEMDVVRGEKINSISFSFEACSEAPNYNNSWPSDISVWLNDTRILTFTCPSDFGGTRGNYTPAYWPINCTQFGEMNVIKISDEGISRNNLLIKNNITLNDFDLAEKESVRFSVGILKDAVHRGGINLFGKNFGNYNQPIKMVVKTKFEKV